MGFLLKKEIALDKFGWADCSLVFNSISYSELIEWQSKAQDEDQIKTASEMVELLTKKFISGTALDEDSKKTELKKEDLGSLPFDIILEAIKLLAGGQQDPNL